LKVVRTCSSYKNHLDEECFKKYYPKPVEASTPVDASIKPVLLSLPPQKESFPELEVPMIRSQERIMNRPKVDPMLVDSSSSCLVALFSRLLTVEPAELTDKAETSHIPRLRAPSAPKPATKRKVRLAATVLAYYLLPLSGSASRRRYRQKNQEETAKGSL